MTRYAGGRLVAWVALVAALALANYLARFAGSGSTTGGRDSLYTYGAAASGLVFYAIFFAFVYAIATVDTSDLFALRRPRALAESAGLVVAIVIGVYIWEGIVSTLPLPQSPSAEQGITPTHWEPSHAGAYAANFVLIAVVAPFVEELTFRGVGFRLLDERYGRAFTLAAIGVAFGLAHGLVEGLIVLVPFGSALAYLRARSGSTVPGMVVHGLFNGIALAFVVLK